MKTEIRYQEHWMPPINTKGYRMLVEMLKGRTVSALDALQEFALETPAARMSELRRAGWPVNKTEVPHPSLPREHISAYFLDDHFRYWYLMTTRQNINPRAYTGQSGRGKFAEESA